MFWDIRVRLFTTVQYDKATESARLKAEINMIAWSAAWRSQRARAVDIRRDDNCGLRIVASPLSADDDGTCARLSVRPILREARI